MTIQYKYANPNKTAVNDQINGIWNITQYSSLWNDVQKWVDEGNVIEDYQTSEETLKISTNEANSNLKKLKREKKSEGILVDGILFDTDNAARISYLELMIKFMINPDYTVADWKASDGVWVEMNKTLFDSIITAWEVRLTDLFTFVKAKENEIKTSDNPENVDLEYTGT